MRFTNLDLLPTTQTHDFAIPFRDIVEVRMDAQPHGREVHGRMWQAADMMWQLEGDAGAVARAPPAEVARHRGDQYGDRSSPPTLPSLALPPSPDPWRTPPPTSGTLAPGRRSPGMSGIMRFGATESRYLQTPARTAPFGPSSWRPTRTRHRCRRLETSLDQTRQQSVGARSGWISLFHAATLPRFWRAVSRPCRASAAKCGRLMPGWRPSCW